MINSSTEAPITQNPCYTQPFFRLLNKDCFLAIKEIEDNLDKNLGVNVLEGGRIEDMIAAGVIDPKKVTRAVVENAGSATINVMCTSALIANDPDEKKNDLSLGGGMPGGAEEELEFGVAAADSLGDPFFDEPFRGGAVAGRGERLQAGQ